MEQHKETQYKKVLFCERFFESEFMEIARKICKILLDIISTV